MIIIWLLASLVSAPAFWVRHWEDDDKPYWGRPSEFDSNSDQVSDALSFICYLLIL